MKYEVEYLHPADQRLEKLIVYLKKNLPGLVAPDAYQAELSYVQRAVDQIDSLLAKMPRHIGRPFEQSYILSGISESPEQTRYVTIGPISVIYGIYSQARRVIVFQIVYHQDRN